MSHAENVEKLVWKVGKIDAALKRARLKYMPTMADVARACIQLAQDKGSRANTLRGAIRFLRLDAERS